ILLTGLIVSLIGLEPGTPQDQVGEDTVWRLALLYMVASLVMACIAAFWLARFPITREQHEARVAAKEARGSGTPVRDDPIDDAVLADPDAHSITP
ncbi:MAG: MFS transporter, partial [Pseudomonadota bacterium]